MRGSPDLSAWIVTPAIAVTMRSKSKLVRAIGEVATYTVMLPWGVAVVFIGMFAFMVLIGWSGLENVRERITDWWADV